MDLGARNNVVLGAINAGDFRAGTAAKTGVDLRAGIGAETGVDLTAGTNEDLRAVTGVDLRVGIRGFTI